MSWKVLHILCWSPLPLAKIKLKINLENKGVTVLQIRKGHIFYLQPWLDMPALGTFLCEKKHFTTFPEVSCLTREPLEQGPPKYSQPMLETRQWQLILLRGCLKSWLPQTLSLFLEATKLGTFPLILHFYHFSKPQPMFSNIYTFEQFFTFQKQLTQLTLKQV